MAKSFLFWQTVSKKAKLGNPGRERKRGRIERERRRERKRKRERERELRQKE